MTRKTLRSPNVHPLIAYSARLLLLYLLVTIAVCDCASRNSPKTDQGGTARPIRAASASVAHAQPVTARPSGSITFTDISEQAGIHFKHNSGAYGAKLLSETMGSGVCIIDYDNDGWQDILFVNSMDWPGHGSSKSYPALYHNNHNGTFTDVTRQAGLAIEMYGLGCAVGDFDDDGYDDIYITAIGGSRLFRNLRCGRFADATAQAGLADSGFPTGAAWFDYDNDGRLDLVVAHYVEWSPKTDQFCSLDGKHKSYCTPEAYKGQSVRLFHNLGNGRFADVTKHAGLYDSTDKSLGIALIDYDNDGWLDLFISNDTQPNKLYHNNRNGTFSEAGFAAGIAFSDAGRARAGMGTDAGDYDNSGHQSLVIGNFSDEGMTLYQNDGSGLFADQAAAAGIASPSLQSLTFGCFFFDYDLDGHLDIFAANGHVADDISVVRPNLHYAEPPLLFHNLGGGRFAEISASSGSALRRPMVARGAAYADFDNNGDLDVVVNTNDGLAHFFRNNNANRNDLVRVKLIGTKSNRDAIGARIFLTAVGGMRQLAMVKSGSSYLSQSELPITFGLGKPGTVKDVTLEIAWPSGRKGSLTHVAVDRSLVIVEGKGIVSTQPIAFTHASTQ